jgi:TRAP-type C4-dicarboxylate transport system substrate-binding protein
MPDTLPPQLRAALREALVEALEDQPGLLQDAVREELQEIALEDAVAEIHAFSADPAHRAHGGLFAVPQAQA